MAFNYTFTESEVSQLDAARVVFNHFTKSKLNFQQFLKFTIEAAIEANNESADIALHLHKKAKLYNRIDVEKYQAKYNAKEVH